VIHIVLAPAALTQSGRSRHARMFFPVAVSH
jgi:hypothetical protein